MVAMIAMNKTRREPMEWLRNVRIRILLKIFSGKIIG